MAVLFTHTCGLFSWIIPMTIARALAGEGRSLTIRIPYILTVTSNCRWMILIVMQLMESHQLGDLKWVTMYYPVVSYNTYTWYNALPRDGSYCRFAMFFSWLYTKSKVILTHSQAAHRLVEDLNYALGATEMLILATLLVRSNMAHVYILQPLVWPWHFTILHTFFDLYRCKEGSYLLAIVVLQAILVNKLTPLLFAMMNLMLV